MKQTAAAAGCRPTFKCSVASLARMLDAAWASQMEREEQRPWSLACLRRNGYLHWRPLAAEQEWAAELPQGSYRLQSTWLEQRGLFMAEKEKRDEAMKQLKDAKLRADQSEIAYCHHEGYSRARFNGEKLLETHLEVEVEELEEEVLLQALPYFQSLDPKVQRRLKKAALQPGEDERQLGQKQQAKNRLKQKRKRKELKAAKEAVQELRKTHNRSELLKSMVPTAGKTRLGSFAAKMQLSLGGLLKPGRPTKEQQKALKDEAKALQKKSKKQKKQDKKNQKKTELKKQLKYAGGKGKLQRQASEKSLKKDEKKKAVLKAGKEAVKQLESELPALPAAEPLDPAEEKVQVTVCSEHAGKQYYGRTGVVAVSAWQGSAELLNVDLQPGLQAFRREFLEQTSILPDLKMLTLQSVKRSDMQVWLREAALKTLGDDLGDDVEVPRADGSWLLDQHMTVAWLFLRWSLPGLKAASVSFVRPDVVQAFVALADPTTNLEGLGDAEWLKAAGEMQERRRAFLEAELQKDLVFVPIYAGQHWTLLEISRLGSVQVKYYDSLQVESAASRQVADFFLETLLPGVPLPARANAARQPAGTGQCGSYCLHWVEQRCRSHLGGRSLVWPTAATWAARLQSLCKALQKEQAKIDEAKLKAQEKQILAEAKAKLAAAKKKKKEGDMKDLAEKAAESLLKDPAGKPCFENLTADGQCQVLKILEGYTGGTCSRCRTGDGCLSCSKWKATRYWLKKEGFDVEHMYGASGAALYQRSKVQRAAQLAAYGDKQAKAPQQKPLADAALAPAPAETQADTHCCSP